MADLIITPSTGKIEFIHQGGQAPRIESIILHQEDGLVFSGKISASSVTAPLNVINVTAGSSNVNYPFIFASSGETGAKSLLMDSAGGTYNPSTNTATIDVSGNSATTTLASNSTQLGGVAAANYVTLTDTQTLTNKTITGTFTGNLTGTGSWATNATNALQLGGTAAASYVTLTGTQTLTGKTITGTFTGNLTGTSSWASNALTSLACTGNAATVTNGLYTNSTLTAGNLSGTIPSAVLGNSTVYIGSTAVPLNRANTAIVLTGITSIDGNAATATNSTQLNGQAASYYTDINARLGYTPVNKAGDTVTGNLIINGNFSVNGSFTAFSASNVYISSSQLYIEDNILTLNAFSPYLRYAGVEMYDSGSGTLSSLLWDGEADYFFLTGSSVNGKIITGPDGQTNLSSNFVAKATAGNKLGNSLIYDNGTNVGIGTTTVNQKVSIYPGTTGGISLQDIDSETRSYFFIDNTNGIFSTGIRTANYYLDFDSSGGAQNAIRFYTGTSTIGTGTERMRIISTGNVGIGTNTPGARLEISSSTAASLLNIKGAGGNNLLFVSGSGAVGIGTTTTNHLLHLSTISNDVSVGLYTTNANASARNWLISANEVAYGDFNIKQSNAIGGNPRSAGTSRFYIQNDGNVGIGTTSPNAKLDVNGNTIVTGSLTVTSTIVARNYIMATDTLYIQKGVGGYQSYITAEQTAASTGNSFKFWNSGTATLMTIGYDGNVGIGTSSPTSKLHVVETTATGSRIQLGSISTNALMNTNLVNDFLILTAPFNAVPASVSNNNAKWGIKMGGGSTDAPNISGKSACIYAVSEEDSVGGLGYNRKVGLALHTSPFDLPNVERVRINNLGNVGIGTSSPAAKLDISGSATTIALSFGITVPNNPLFINTYGSNTGIGMDQATAGLRLAGDYGGGSNPLVDIGYYSGGTVSHANWISRLKVLNNGNVGIGIAVPTAPLHVVGVISGSSFTGAGTGLTGTAASLSIGGTAATATTASYSLNTTLTTAATYPITSSWATNAVTALNGGVTSISAGTGIGTSASTGAVTITNSSPNATHTGDVTGATTLTIANDAVTTVKILNANVTNAKLANSAVTIGSTAVSLGGTVTTFAGLASVTSTAFVGALTGNVTGNVTGTAGSETFATVTGRGASTTTQISVGTTAGGSMYTGIKSGAGYSDAVSGATFKSITDHPTGGSYAFAAYFNGAPGTGTNSFFVAADGTGYFRGNVGIGTTSALGKLHVYGLLRVGGAANEQTGIIALGNDANPVATYGDNGMFRGGIGSLGTGNYTNISSYQGIVFNVEAASFGSQATRMLISTDGNVGIGTTSVGSPLEVYGTSMDPSLTPSATSIFNVNSLGVELAIGRMVTSPFSLWLQGKHATVTGSLTYPIVLNPLGGFVGIGTTSPANRFEVVGSTFNRASFIATANVQTGIQIQRTGGVSNTSWEIYSPASSGDLRIHNGSDYVTFQSGSGNVGIGTNNPSSKIHIYENANRVTYITQNNNHTARFEAYGTATAIDTTASNGIFFRISGGDIVKFAADGNVGIGTSNATAKLESYFSSNALTINYLATNLNGNSPIPAYGFSVTDGSAETRSIKAGIGYERYLTNGRGVLHFYNDSTNDTASISGTRSAAGDIKMSLDNSGNLGIGTTVPSALLNIRASAPTGTGTVTTGTNVLIDSNTSNYITFRNTADNGTYAGLVFLDNNVGGYIAFGNAGATVGSDSMIYGAYQDHIFQNGYVNENLYNRTETMRIKQNGNVGIGTTNPTTLLHVVGVISGSSFSGAGTGLTGTAAGLSIGGTATSANAVSFTEVELNAPVTVSGTWTSGSGSEWGEPKFGTSFNQFRYTDGNGPYVEYNIPSNHHACFISQLQWDTGGYADCHGVQSDGDLVFLRRINTRQLVENSNHGNTIQHDGATVSFVGSGLGSFTKIRITNRSGRIHMTGIAFTRQVDDGYEGTGMVHPAQISHQGSGSGLDADLLDGYSSATANTANTIVLRDASGNFSAGTITATLSGTATTATNSTQLGGVAAASYVTLTGTQTLLNKTLSGSLIKVSNGQTITEYAGYVATPNDYPTCTEKARIYTIGTINASAVYNSFIEIEVYGSHRGYDTTSYYEYKRWVLLLGDKVSSNLVSCAGTAHQVGLWNGTDANGFNSSTAAGTVLRLVVLPRCGAGQEYVVKVRYANVDFTQGTFTYTNLLTNPSVPTIGNQTINISGNAATATTAANGGVTSISAGTGIGTSASTGAVTITNSSPNATHTGDVTGATALTIANDAVTTVKILNANVTNAKLANSSLTIGSTAVSLGATATTIAGLTSVTSTTFVGALTGNASTATNSTQLGGVAASKYIRNDSDGTAGDIFSLITVTKSLTLTTSWIDTGISGSSDLANSGAYILTLNADNYAAPASGGQYNETYTGIMYWYAGGTNATDYDEIPLHKSGHAPNGRYINLRTLRGLSGVLKLQIICNVATSGASNYIFKFRRMI